MLLIIRVLKGAVEVLGMLYLAQAMIFLFAGPRREGNFAFRLLKRITGPVDVILRRIIPRFVVDQHMPLVTFFLLALVWIILTALKIKLILFDGRPGP